MSFRVTTDTEVWTYDEIKARAMGRCVKRPVVHGCFMLHEPMTFHTETGAQLGKPGMIAVVGADHAWPVSKEYFDAHYDQIERRDDDEVME